MNVQRLTERLDRVRRSRSTSRWPMATSSTSAAPTSYPLPAIPTAASPCNCLSISSFHRDVVAEHEGAVMPGVFNLDGDRVVDAFRRLAELDVDIACFGHGDPLLAAAGDRLRAVAGTLGGPAA